MKFVLDLAAVLQIVAVLSALLGVAAWLWRTARSMTKLMQRIDRLEERVDHRKKDSEMTLKAVLACLEGLREQGCNGPVTQAIQEVKAYIIESR